MTTTTPQSAETGRPITLPRSLQGRRGPHNAPVLDAAGQSGPLTAPRPTSRASPPLGSPAADLTSTPATADNAVKRRPPRRSPSATTREPAPTTRAAA